MRADLHTHSSRSDGVLQPADLVRQAHAAGLDCIALTDHDSVAGIAEASPVAAELGLTLIPGVELSIRDSHGADDHLLGFFIDPSAKSLVAWLRQLQFDRERMADHTLRELEHLGLPLRRERVAELASGAVVTRPHIARAMVEAGYVSTEQEAFDRFLGSGKPAAPRRPSAPPSTAITAIREAGGVACLAHPVFCQDPGAAQRLLALPPRLSQLVADGLHAIECFYPDATPEVSQQLEQLAHQHGLIVTAGSDFHGPGKAPNAPLGAHTVGENVLEALRLARPDLRGSRT